MLSADVYPSIRRKFAPWLLIVPISAAVILTAAAAFGKAQSGAGVLCEALDCAESQSSEIGSILRELHAGSTPEYQTILQLEQRFALELVKDRPDPAAIQRNLDQIAQQRKTIDERVRNAMLAIHAVLDRQQRSKLVAMMGTGKLLGVFKRPPPNVRN